MTKVEAIEEINKAFEPAFANYIITALTEGATVSDKALEQEPKIGHWVEEDVFDGDVAYRCSECNELFWIESGTPKDNEYNFCPKCGCRMVEQERSDKE